MELSQEKMIDYLEQAVDVGVENVIFADNEPFPPLEYYSNRHPCPRIIMPLRGLKMVGLSIDGIPQTIEISPGTALFGRYRSWIREFWTTDHEMVSIVFHNEMIRVLYIHHNGLPPDQNGPDIYFHTSNPLSAPGVHMEKALIAMSEGQILDGAPELMQALIRFSLREIKNDRKGRHGKALFTWNSIMNYLSEHWFEDLNRDEVAMKFKIHPAHLSRIVRRYAGVSFCEYVMHEKMYHASQILTCENLTVDEVAVRCGFKYTSYFIRVFGKTFHESPNAYRERHFAAPRRNP